LALPIGANLLAAYTLSLANFAGRQSAGYYRTLPQEHTRGTLLFFEYTESEDLACVSLLSSFFFFFFFRQRPDSFQNSPFATHPSPLLVHYGFLPSGLPPFPEPKTPGGNLEPLLVLELQP
jgi:hypothetical protein